MRPFCSTRILYSKSLYARSLYAERGSAAASALYVGVLELETGAFQGFDVVDDAAVQIHHRGGIDEDLQSIHVEGLVHHSGSVFKLHGIGEAGAAATDHANAQASGHGTLLSHNFLHFGNRVWRKRNRRSFLHFRHVSIYFGDGCRGHSYLLGSKVPTL